MVRALPLLLLVVLIGVGAWFWYDSWARHERELAEAALRRHDLVAAAAHLERHLQRRPDDAASWFLAARTARRLNRYAKAEQYLEQYQRLAGVTDATLLEWDLLRVQRGQLRDIDSRLRQTVGPEHPDAFVVLEALIQGYYLADRLPDAMQGCDLWLSRDPTHPRAWLWRGRVFELLRIDDRAVTDYDKAVQCAPDDTEARLTLASFLLHLRRPDEAAEHFEYLLGRDPDDEAALLGAAACRLESNSPASAVPLLDRVLARNPSSPEGLSLRGKAAWSLGDLEGAERWLREAVRLKSRDPEPLHLLVQCLRAREKDAEAVPLAERLEHLRKDIRRLAELARACWGKPNDPILWHQTGEAALQLGDTDEAVRWFKGALRARADHRPSHLALADIYARRGDTAAAEHHRHLAGNPE